MSDENNSVEKVERILNDFAEKLENSKNHAAQDMLESIREQQKIVVPLTQLGREVIDSISKDILNPDLTIPIDVKLFALKTISEYSTKHLQAVTNAFKADGQTQADRKKNLPKPGLNSLLDEQGVEVSKNKIKMAKEVSKNLQEHVTKTTEMVSQFNNEQLPEEK